MAFDSGRQQFGAYAASARMGGRLLPGGEILEDAITRAPDFAPAWSSLASLYVAALNPVTRQSGSVEEIRKVTQSLLDKAEMAARKSIELDPRHASGYGELGRVESRRLQFAEAEAHFQQALALDSDDPETLQAYGLMLGYVGRLKDALQTMEKLSAVEPFVPIYNIQLGIRRHINGQDAAAIALLEAMPGNVGNYNRNYALAMAYASTGQYEKAADTVLLINQQVSRQAVEEAARLLRTAPAKVSAPQQLPTLQADLNFVYAHIGALERVLEFPEQGVEVGVANSGIIQVWAPELALMRKTERFKAYARKAGMVDYWRAKGWPDLCRPMGADDFVCD